MRTIGKKEQGLWGWTDLLPNFDSIMSSAWLWVNYLLHLSFLIWKMRWLPLRTNVLTRVVAVARCPSSLIWVLPAGLLSPRPPQHWPLLCRRKRPRSTASAGIRAENGSSLARTKTTTVTSWSLLWNVLSRHSLSSFPDQYCLELFTSLPPLLKRHYTWLEDFCTRSFSLLSLGHRIFPVPNFH